MAFYKIKHLFDTFFEGTSVKTLWKCSKSWMFLNAVWPKFIKLSDSTVKANHLQRAGVPLTKKRQVTVFILYDIRLTIQNKRGLSYFSALLPMFISLHMD